MKKPVLFLLIQTRIRGSLKSLELRSDCVSLNCSRIIADSAKHTGGINIFGRGFGDYDQDITLRLYMDDNT
jgi:predicted transcriptional regulator